MSFARALVIAFMTAAFVRSPDWSERLAAIAFAAVIWFGVTTDPLPAAVERGLQTFAKRYRND
ncbi:hypothetical protein [Sphingomonas paucimobilis]|uniref:hypothetical protein n=1 Tax=Sphingomonas paucimobilis TaxID=13689 RepID=UPI00064C1083|nr:hypothetical protein [Sphingomonas paucimobilis]